MTPFVGKAPEVRLEGRADMSQFSENERRTRKNRIDPKLTACGWEIVRFDPTKPNSRFKKHAIEEYPTANGPADYAFVVDGQLLGVVEAKKVSVGPAAPRSPSDVQERVIGLLGGASAKILQPIIEAYPNAVARTDVAAAAGYTHLQSKGFVNALSRLSSLGFVSYPDRGTVAAAPVLFLENA